MEPTGIDHVIPFAGAFDPWVAEAESSLPACGPLISPTVLRDLSLGLRSTLATAAGRSLLELFAEADPSARRDGDRRYRSFVRHCTSARGREELLAEFPVLAELLECLVAQWVAASGELIHRLEADHAVLIARLGLDDDVPVTGVSRPLGDRHHHGRTVFSVEFGGGPRVAYKPRPLVTEAHVYEMLRRFAPAQRTVPWVVDRGDHGWTQWLSGSTVHDATVFWRHVGAASAVLSLCGVNDLHMGNVIACAHGIAVLDVECMGKPDSSGRERWRPVTESVLSTGLFPNWFVQGGPVAREACGLFGSPMGTDGRWYPRWQYLGTDAIGIGTMLGRGADGDGTNRPVGADGRPVDVDLEALTAGFGDTAAVLRDAPGVGDDWPDEPTRFLLRSTGVYATRLVEMTTPEVLRAPDRFEDAARSLPDLGADWKDALIAGHEDAVAAAEAAALRRLDIPLHRADGHDLVLEGGERLVGVFELSGSDVRAGKLAAFDRAGRQRQCALIRLHVEQVDARLVTPRPLATVEATEPLEVAAALASALMDERIDSGGVPTWLELDLSGGGVFSGAVDRYDMYDGADGVACFLAAVGALTGDEASAALARRIVTTRLPARDDPSGWPSGAAGAAYAKLYVGRLLGDAEVLAGADAAVDALLDREIERSAPVDLVGGSAGVVAVASAALAAGMIDDAAIGRVEVLADRYLDAVRHHLDDQVLRRHATMLGVAHGARGIVHVLARIGAQLGDPRARAMAAELEAVDRERRERRGIGASLVRSTPRRPRHGWCAGASGHAMALADDLDRLGGAADLAAAFAELTLDAPEDRHGLCCGVAGIAVATEELHRRFPASTAAREAFEKARDALLASATGAVPVTFVPGSSLHGASLFMGRSGLGWALCRIADPARIPNLLLVD